MIESDYRFTEKEWAVLPFNIHDKKSGYSPHFGVIDRFPELRSISEFTAPIEPKAIDKDKVISYIIMFYSPTTPLNKIPDIIERKKTAAIESGMDINTETNRLSPEYEDILFCRNKHVNGMIISYLRKFKNTKWSLLCTGNESFYLKLKMILDITNDSESKTDQEIEKVRGELFKQAETMEASISRLSDEFLNDDSPYLKEDLFSFIEKQKTILMLSPELRHAQRSTSEV